MHRYSQKTKCMMKKWVYVVLLGMAIAGCKGPEYPPEFRSVENLRLAEVNGNTAKLKGDAVFYNPNDEKMTLRAVDVDIWIEDKEIGKVTQNEKIKIPASEEFTVPLDAEVRIEDMGIVSTLLNVLGGRKMKVRYEGHIKATMRGLPIKVPVEYDGEVRLR